MKSGKCLQVGLTSFLIFTFICSPLVTCTSRFNTALAAAEQSIEPEGPPNGHEVNDPYERLNRKVFEFNDRVYFRILKPVGSGYAAVLPYDVRIAIKSGFHNLVFPARFVNSVLQGKPDKAGIETVRFVINSAMGLAACSMPPRLSSDSPVTIRISGRRLAFGAREQVLS